MDRYLTGGDGDGLVLMDWYEIEVGQRTAGNNHQYYIKIRFIFTLTRLTVAFYLDIFVWVDAAIMRENRPNCSNGFDGWFLEETKSTQPLIPMLYLRPMLGPISDIHS